ncbi:unnamed protein product [Moneuplotes crassus]|uniref:Uncharacterized protein n=1 Tax=Euplotes crassus TaxID=5936 RepID=A0AAD2D2B5_EUPCR|nr:unnamed protein product [Moneuplotes crassus]
MEFAFLAWLYDKRVMLGLPYLYKGVIKYCLLIPIWSNIVMLILSQFAGGSGNQCCERANNDGCDRLPYQILLLINVIVAITLMVSAQLKSLRKERKLLIEQKMNASTAREYFKTYDFYWTRILYTNSFLTICLIMTSLAFTIYGTIFISRYHNGRISPDCHDSTRVRLIYWHSWVYIISYSYVILLYTACVIFKTIVSIFRLKFPLFTKKCCRRGTDAEVERYINDFWTQHKR